MRYRGIDETVSGERNKEKAMQNVKLCMGVAPYALEWIVKGFMFQAKPLESESHYL